jgi:hypothetical protein
MQQRILKPLLATKHAYSLVQGMLYGGISGYIMLVPVWSISACCLEIIT